VGRGPRFALHTMPPPLTIVMPMPVCHLRQHTATGRSSARETIGRVAAAAIAKKVLGLYSGVEIIGYVKKVKMMKQKER
jgi:hypothetical protein